MREFTCMIPLDMPIYDTYTMSGVEEEPGEFIRCGCDSCRQVAGSKTVPTWSADILLPHRKFLSALKNVRIVHEWEEGRIVWSCERS